ncbi:MAG TPA: NEW3 domain-containing protein [Roseiflexaceae bacterium]|nr:NEW3 domain-containing protein [Roseiflexaceae bacterium]
MSRRLWIVVVLSACLALAAAGAPAVLAQESQPPDTGQDLTLFTRYPAQEIAIGDTVTFPLTLRTAGPPQRVGLELQNLPEGWTASFRGDGRAVQAAYVNSKDDTKVDLRVEVPKDAAPETYRFTVLARGERAQVTLPIELVVKDKAPSGLTLNVELPTLRGAPDTTFRYDVQLEYGGDQDTTVNLLADAPKGMYVDFKLGGQDVTSVPLAANESKRVTIEVRPFPDLPAGSYAVKVLAQGGEVQAETVLVAEVTGRPQLALTGPDGRLSGEAQIGATTPFKLIVQNTGSAPARAIEMSASQPAGWTVTFEPQVIPELPAGQSAEVTASVKPADQAVAGDYVLTFTARPEDSPAKSAEFRVTLLTSTLWGLVGVALIALAVAVVGLAVMRFGRR